MIPSSWRFRLTIHSMNSMGHGSFQRPRLQPEGIWKAPARACLLQPSQLLTISFSARGTISMTGWLKSSGQPAARPGSRPSFPSWPRSTIWPKPVMLRLSFVTGWWIPMTGSWFFTKSTFPSRTGNFFSCCPRKNIRPGPYGLLFGSAGSIPCCRRGGSS